MNIIAIKSNVNVEKNIKWAQYQDVVNLLTKKDRQFHISYIHSYIYANRSARQQLENSELMEIKIKKELRQTLLDLRIFPEKLLENF